MKLSAVLGLAIVDPDQFSLRAPFPRRIAGANGRLANGPVTSTDPPVFADLDLSTVRQLRGQRDAFKPTTFVFFIIRRFPHSQRSSRIGTILLPCFVSE
jgi:hypothetical protein